MVREHGWKVDHTTIFRWVQRYGPQLAARCRAYLKPTNRSYRIDETYIKGQRRRSLSLSSRGLYRPDH
jgi:IS6 family transposase